MSGGRGKGSTGEGGKGRDGGGGRKRRRSDVREGGQKWIRKEQGGEWEGKAGGGGLKATWTMMLRWTRRRGVSKRSEKAKYI